MSDVVRLQPVTMISEAFTPTPEVRRAIREFLDKGMTDDSLELRSTGFRIVDTQEYYAHKHDPSILLAEKALADCGSAPLALTGRSDVKEGHNGAARLLLEVADSTRLAKIVAATNHIQTLEYHRPTNNLLYVDLARDALTKNVQRRIDARDKLSSRSRHPGMKSKLVVSAPRILTRDIPLYPLRTSMFEGTETA